jgi:hypothetical protein
LKFFSPKISKLFHLWECFVTLHSPLPSTLGRHDLCPKGFCPNDHKPTKYETLKLNRMNSLMTYVLETIFTIFTVNTNNC